MRGNNDIYDDVVNVYDYGNDDDNTEDVGVLITLALLNMMTMKMLIMYMTMLMTQLLMMIPLPMMSPSRVSQQSGKEGSGKTVMEEEKESFKTAAMSEKKTVRDRYW